MEPIIFIIAWIVIGVIALYLMYNDVLRVIAAPLPNQIEDGEDPEPTKEDIARVSDEVANLGKGYSRIFTIAVLLFSVAAWPIVVPIVMYSWRKQRNDAS